MSGITSGDNPALYPLGFGAIHALDESTEGAPPADTLESNDFPVLRGPADLPNAWAAAVASKEPDEARDRLVRIAFNNGWEGSLPRAAREWIGDRSGTVFAGDPKIASVATGNVLDDLDALIGKAPSGSSETHEDARGQTRS